MASVADKESTTRYICNCSKYNFGKPHPVSLATWYCHIDEADTETEKQFIRSTRVCQATLHLMGTVHRHGDITQAMEKRCLETVEDARHHIGRRKCAWVQGNSSHLPDLPRPAPDGEDIPPHMPNLSHPANDNKDVHVPDVHDPTPDDEDRCGPDVHNPTPADEDRHGPDVHDPTPDDEDRRGPDVHDPTPDDEDRHAPARLLLEDCGNSPFPFNIEYECRAHPIVDVEALAELAVLPSMQHSIQFILALKNVSLNDLASKLTLEGLEKIQNPPSHRTIPIDNKGIRYSISAYLALENASQLVYNCVCQAVCSTFSGSPGMNDILTFQSVEKLIASYTGVISVEHDMCHNTCVAFTGPFSQLEACPMCNMSRWKEERLQGTHGRSKIAAQTFTTIPIGPQLQALY